MLVAKINCWLPLGHPALARQTVEPSGRNFHRAVRIRLDYPALEKAGQLAELNRPQKIRVANSNANVKFNLLRQGVTLFMLTWF